MTMTRPRSAPPVSVCRNCALILAQVTANCSSHNALPNVGLALSLAPVNRKLFVVNPDLDQVEARDIDTGTLLASIPVGTDPVDVVVVKKGGTDEKAFVLDRSDRTITEIDVLDLTAEPPFSMAENQVPSTTLYPVAIAARSDGMRLYTADTTHRTISVITIAPQDPPARWVHEVPTDVDPRRLVVLSRP